jgi:hypothetical protein
MKFPLERNMINMIIITIIIIIITELQMGCPPGGSVNTI